MSGVDQIMRLADEWYAHGQTSHSGIDEKYAALRAAVEQVIAENLQRGNVIGRISAHLLGNKNNVTDEDVVIAAAEVGRELQGARERIERLQALVAPHEPVAWMVYTQDGKSVFVTDNPTDIPPNCTALPLFTESKA